MKTTILNKEVNEEIDWSKPQWVTSKMGHIVFTNGKCDNYNDSFEGTCIPCDKILEGEFFQSWDKKSFQPIPKDGLTIHIQND
jgi:hypothetical protein